MQLLAIAMARCVLPVPVPPTRTTWLCWAMKAPPARGWRSVWLIGIEVGPVVIDGQGEIFGDVPNIAARVQALAEPGSVLVTARVQRHVAGLFVVEQRGSYDLKGIAEPQILFRLVRAGDEQ